jgi:cytochrome c
MTFDSYEFSKVAGAVICALLLIVVPRTLIGMRVQSHGSDKPGFALPMPVAEGAAAPAAGAKDAPAAGKEAPKDQPIAALLGAASADNGKTLFGKCAACHTATKGGASTVGPNLWNIIGRTAGSHEGFAYSAALKKKAEEGMKWDFESLSAWIEADEKVVPGNKMIFAGIADASARADLLAYMRTLADNPAPLPK